jgi:hypothetical protein
MSLRLVPPLPAGTPGDPGLTGPADPGVAVPSGQLGSGER